MEPINTSEVTFAPILAATLTCDEIVADPIAVKVASGAEVPRPKIGRAHV